MFEARSDKLQYHREVKFDFTAYMTGTGNRSLHKISGILVFIIEIDSIISPASVVTP